ncbi:MAG TPA: beta-propeller fold lactonase family protein [Terriglobales bacterium]|nr:beta-propeller fold lactonase family protein [Terriglobales bacterium]
MITGWHRSVLLSLTALFLTNCGGSGSTHMASSGSSVAPASLPPCGIEGTGKNVQDCSGPGLEQLPTGNSLIPTCAPVGGVAFTLLVVGSGDFSADSVVQWNGSDRPTTVDGAQLYAEISASDIAAAGTATVTVKSGRGASSFSALTFTISAGGVSPQSVAVDPTGKFAYVASTGCPDSFVGSVSMYTIDATTGVLTSLGSPVAADYGPHSLAVDPTGKFVYVANDGDYEATAGSVSVFTIDATSGALSLMETLDAPCAIGPGSCAPSSVAVHPSGKFVYVANEGGFAPTTLSMYAANVTTGALGFVGLATAAGRAVSVAVHPSGQFAYLVNGFDTPASVSMYAVNSSTGALMSGGTIAAGTSPGSIAVDPTGKFAYVTNAGSNDVSMYTINASNGVMTSGGTIAAGAAPSSIAVDPTGKFAYVTNAGSNDVSMYTINAATGALTPVGRIDAGASPVSVTVDPAGKFAYVANSNSNNVSMYSIDAATGVLTALGTVGS